MDDFSVDGEEFSDELEFSEPESPNPERRYRSLGVLAIVGTFVVLVLLILINSFSDIGEVTAYTIHADSSARAAKDTRHRQHRAAGIMPPPFVLSRMKLLDTVYTTDSVYLDVNLAKQDVTLHFRDGGTRAFRISSGNKNIPEGIATPTGLFTVQGMQPMAISKQFNDAKLYHWIGVQGGVGFHGLEGNGYYGNLGVRPSSHGCIRMSREEIAEMYKLVHPGALIMVRNGEPARTIAFCNADDTLDAQIIDSAAVYSRSLGKERLHALYDGRYWVDPQPRLVHLAHQRVRWGMEIGEAQRIPKQEIPRITFLDNPESFVNVWHPDRSRISTIRGDVYLALQRAVDSTRKAERAQWKKEEETTTEFGD